MLSDPLVVKIPSLAAHSALTIVNSDSYARVDAGDGSARYVVAANTVTNKQGTLRIAHSVSNENKPAKTDRTLVRLDVLCQDSEGREMTAFAYAVIGIPRGALMDGGEDPISGIVLTEALIGALGVSTSGSALDETKLTRILAGES